MNATYTVMSGRDLFPGQNAYAALSRLPPGLMLDIGAAAGFQTRLMIRSSPGSHVIAFEPFPGNWTHFAAMIDGSHDYFRDKERPADLSDCVELIKKAVCDHSAGVEFDVASTVVAGREGVWGNLEGYSSVGRIVARPEPRATLRRIRNAITRRRNVGAPARLRVPSCTVDEVLGERSAVFAKVDVQGAEPAVLRGAQRALQDHRVKIWLIEYRGQQDILDMLHGYQIYDTEYLIIPKSSADPDLSGWEVSGTRMLSTGVTAINAWPESLPDGLSYAEFLQQARRRFHVETDLLCVAPDVADRYLS